MKDGGRGETREWREEKEGGWERRMDNNEGEGWQMCGEEGGRGSGGGKREGGRGGTEKMLLCGVIFCFWCATDCPQGPNSGADCVSCAPRV